MCDENEIKEAYEKALKLVKQCNEIVLEGFRSASKQVEVKGKHWDLVTKYDQRVEDTLIAGLRNEFPHHKFCAEESAFASGDKLTLGPEPTWIIDPIDGTVNFVRGVPFTCISVALVVGHEIQIGIIANPTANELFTAIKGQGSFLNGTRIKTRDIKELKDALVGHEFSIGSYKPIRAALFERGQRFIAECSYPGGVAPSAPLLDAADVAAYAVVLLVAYHDVVVHWAHDPVLPAVLVVVHSCAKGVEVAEDREDWPVGHRVVLEVPASPCAVLEVVPTVVVHDVQGLACAAGPDFDRDVAEVPAGTDCAVTVMVQGFGKVLVAVASGCFVALD
uniref:Inositol-1-monophosphatase n=1 Tax=Anopheles epiroticus TaxID=199890 RepID=A0A182PWG5_9DIPT